MRLPLLAATALLSTPALAQSGGSSNAGPGPEATVVGHVNKFKQLDPDPASLKVPEGFRVDLVARDLGNARMIAVADNGIVYVTRRNEGDVLMLIDDDRNGVFEGHRTVASRPSMHGIALDGDTMFLVTIKDVLSAPIRSDGTLGPLTTIVDDLPDAGQHPNRTIAVGPDGKLYLSVGSTCNACAENNPENATIVRMDRDGTHRQVFASGLRNTIGFAWNPRDAQLWGLDHGVDWLGDDQQSSEINRIEQGHTYGWPYILGKEGLENPQDRPPAGLTMADWRAMTTLPELGWTAHSAPMQLAFDRGTNFPSAMQGDAFAAYRGSWNREAPSGYEVVRIRFDRQGRATAVEPFVTGWLKTVDGQIGWTGRPTGLAFEPSGAMLVGDPENGAIYRVSYTGRGAARPLPMARPAGERAVARPIATKERGLTGRGALAVRSADIAPGGTIPMLHSAYDQNISPALSWGAGPAGTRAYAIVAEDPDAGTPAPIVHWLAWNIPAGTTSLPQGIAGGPQLAEPKGVRQGLNARGTIGWHGPRPPVGDRAHGYHLQVFALDRELDLLPGARREDVTAAMAGHVLAAGELVGTYAQPTHPD